MIEFEINTHRYKTSKMGVMTQWAIARRIAPVVAHVMTPELMKNVMALKGPDDAPVDIGKMMELFSGIFNPLVDALSQMKDEDNEFVINHCLATVNRQTGGGWTVLKPMGSGLMFEDIDLLEMMQIVFRVIIGTVGNFSFASLSNLVPKAPE